MSVAFRTILGVLLAGLVTLGQKKPDAHPTDPSDIVEACFGEDAWNSKGRIEQARLIKLLEPVAPLSDKEEKK